MAVGGYTTQNLIDDNYIQAINRLDPSIIFVMIGFNDLYRSRSLEDIKKDYLDLFNKIAIEDRKIIVQSILYSLPNKFKYEVDDLNAFLVELSTKKGYIYLDLNTKLSNKESLIKKYTYDGIHLTKDAYNLWSKDVQLILGNLNL